MYFALFSIFIARDKYTPWRRSNRPCIRAQLVRLRETDKPRNSGARVSAISDVARDVKIERARKKCIRFTHRDRKLSPEESARFQRDYTSTYDECVIRLRGCDAITVHIRDGRYSDERPFLIDRPAQSRINLIHVGRYIWVNIGAD